MQSGIDTLNESDYSPNGNENRGEWLNTWIEIALFMARPDRGDRVLEVINLPIPPASL